MNTKKVKDVQLIYPWPFLLAKEHGTGTHQTIR
jgi:hypothetical protein